MTWMKLLSYILMLLSIFTVYSSDSFFLMWFSFELNLVSFMLIMWDGKSFSVVNSMMKYYIIQAFSSILFLMSLLISDSFQMYYLSVNMLSMILLYKMGLFPFFFWISDVVEGMSWDSLILFLTFQKFIPLYVFNMMDFFFLMFMVVMSMMFGLMLMVNQSSVRKFLAFSSLVHSGWMILAVEASFNVWFMYMVIYFFTLFFFYWMGNLSSFFQLKNFSKMDMILIMMMFLNLSGLPPFLGFFSKIYTMMYLVNSNLYILIFLVITSVISSYIYLTYMSMMYFFNKNYSKFEYTTYFMVYLFLVISIFIFLILMIF